MAVFIALLKGINVGKSRRISMADLKQAFEELGLRHVETYIQSGNVIFESDDETDDILRKKIEKQIETSFGFEAIVVLRTAAELEKLIEECPFSAEEVMKSESFTSWAGIFTYCSGTASAPRNRPQRFRSLSLYARSETGKLFLQSADWLKKGSKKRAGEPLF